MRNKRIKSELPQPNVSTGVDNLDSSEPEQPLSACKERYYSTTGRLRKLALPGTCHSFCVAFS